MRHLVAGLLWLYQLTLSFWLGRNCRFLPTCSEYTRQAVLRFGVVRGLRLGGRRLLRCHPWGPSQASVTFDPVPDSWQGTPCQHERCHPR